MILSSIENPEAFLAKLREFWNERGFPEGRPGVEIGELLELAKSELEDSALISSWLTVFREAISWCTSCFFLYEWQLLEHKNYSDNVITNVVMLSKILADANSILLLIEGGFDSSARQITRSLSEEVDALHYLLLFPNCQREFLSAQTTDEQNRFWFQHLAKGKARKAIRAYMEQLHDAVSFIEAIEDIQSPRLMQDKDFSATIHPTGFIGLYTAYPNLHSGDVVQKLPGFLGNSRTSSIRTLRYSCGLLSELVLWSEHFKIATILKPTEKDPTVIYELYSHLNLGVAAFMVALNAQGTEV